MTVEVNPSARIQRRGSGDLMAPACCALCGSGNRDVFVDPAIWIEFHGQVYFCGICFEECGLVLGMLSADEANALKGVMKAVGQRNDELEEIRDRYERLVAALHDAGFVMPSHLAPAGVSSSSGEKGSRSERGEHLTSDSPTIPREAKLSVITESVKSTGPNATSRTSGSNGDKSPEPPTFSI